MIVFVGEKPSKRAFQKGWTWESKRLASATLHDALDASGLAGPYEFLNLFGDTPEAREALTPFADARIACLHRYVTEGKTIVAMGQKVARILTKERVPHRRIVHPAARGEIRAKHRYAEHVREVLCV